MTPLALVENLATRWCHLHWLKILQPDDATCISWKFGHQMASLAWSSGDIPCKLQCFQSWPSGRVTCITTLPWIALQTWYLSKQKIYAKKSVNHDNSKFPRKQRKCLNFTTISENDQKLHTLCKTSNLRIMCIFNH